jgi:predicted RNA binding protein YcfA (HicA-like mRNA interferase family)
MKKLKNLTGEEVAKVFPLFRFHLTRQSESHVKFRRLLADGTRQTLTIPIHPELDTQTLRIIYREALRYIPGSQLQPYFFSFQ